MDHDSLTFAALRAANVRRIPEFKNRRGEPSHSRADGSDWCLAQWCNAVCGELGETANLIKKIERGDMILVEARADLARELADVQIYLDILAFRAGVDLGAATIAKWNEVSERVGTRLRLAPDRCYVVGETEPPATAEPGWVYDASEWEWTAPWSERDAVLEHFDPGEVVDPHQIGTMYAGPHYWAIDVPTAWDEDDCPVAWDRRWYSTEAAASYARNTAAPAHWPRTVDGRAIDPRDDDAPVAAGLRKSASTLREHQDRLRSTGRRPLDRDEATRLGYPAADIAREFDE